ncbi:ATP-binding protein [Actinoplanes aureus]|uniref:ATP-binding protein n=1 Tax=Actinoplanes aureus TaxID=2792083 RepID=A0A931CFC5_9ACTN|nr:ATP-binding protein [Actinoplanes aureus]MBG0568850.1 ATP-binding protein [Actinoplanes aureus]
MGQLKNPESWESGLSDLPAVLADLTKWIDSVEYDLTVHKWFDDGRSGNPVALVLRTGHRTPEQLVMKFCGPGLRSRKLGEAWAESEGFRETHLAEKVDGPFPLADRLAVFFEIAGDDIDEYQPLSANRQDPSLAACLRIIVRSVIADWNSRATDLGDRTAGDLLLPIVEQRLTAAENWAHNRGLEIGDDSPFALVSGVDADRPILGPLLGKAHGDLSARNIFVPRDTELRPESYVLIDYDHFSATSLLAFDPMHLVVALALDHFDDFKAKVHADWVKAIVDPSATGLHPGAEWIRNISQEIRDGVLGSFPKRGLPNLWRQQLLLGLVGAGLLHVGRDLHVDARDDARQWCYDLAAAAARALRPTLPATAGGHRQHAARPRSTRRKKRHRRMIDRKSESTTLRRRLTTGPFGAVVLNGLAGIGKSQVLDHVLDDIRDAGPTGSTRVYQQLVDATTRLDLKAFLDALEDRETPSTGPGQASMARLESVLAKLGRQPVIVALDGAENLLKESTQELADLDLDEALEHLTRDPDHRVSVVLALRDTPTSPSGAGWPQVTGPIAIPRLEIEDFFELLEDIDQDGILGLDGLDPVFRGKLHGRLQGNPRDAEIVVALATIADRSISLTELADSLFKWPPGTVSAQLVRLLAKRLGPLRGRVLEALAAFGTPVSADAVVSVLDGEHDGSDVKNALRVFARKRVVYQNEDDDYYLPEPSATVILKRLSNNAEVTLMGAVARVLRDIPDGPVTGVHDLRIRIAELEALLNARRFTDAYHVIEKLCRYHLYDWNAGHLLADQRRRVRFHLKDDHLEMANEDGLADIYVSAGDFQSASEAFGLALDKAQILGDTMNGQKIRLNMANWYLDVGETNQARCYYELVRDDPDMVGNQAVRMGALEGLADCDRRQGHYTSAIRQAKQALTLGKSDFSGDPTAAAYAATGLVLTPMKLSRWYAEQGKHDEATKWMREADKAAGGADADRLRAARLDGWADLRLAMGDVPAAISTADEAVQLARAKRDEVVLLQAHTTLCIAHLMNEENTEQARREARRARLHRKRDRRGRSLLVIGLQALLTVDAGDPDEAKRLFLQLAKESKHRTDDSQDFTAHDMLAFAICGLAVVGDADVTPAEKLFRATRRRVPGTPGLVARLRLLVEKLNEYGDRPGLLDPALDALRTSG